MIIEKEEFEKLIGQEFDAKYLCDHLPKYNIYYELNKYLYRDKYDFYSAAEDKINDITIIRWINAPTYISDSGWNEKYTIYSVFSAKTNLEILIKITKQINNLRPFL